MSLGLNELNKRQATIDIHAYMHHQAWASCELWFKWFSMNFMMEPLWIHLKVKVKKLIHSGWDNMANILQTTFSNPFRSMEIIVYQFKFHWNIWVRSRNCSCLVTCYQLIAKPGNKTATVSWHYPHNVLMGNMPVLVQTMAWRQTGDKPLSDPIIWVTQPQWVKLSGANAELCFELSQHVLSLLMSWLIALPDHQQPWYHTVLCEIGNVQVCLETKVENTYM